MFTQLAKQRRTIYQFSSQPVASDALDDCLEAAIWAPNHGLTEPWRFFVIGEQTRAMLKTIYAQTRANKRAAVGSEAYQSLYQQALQRFDGFPAMVFVAQLRDANQLVEQENYAACACAIQNFQLAAWEQGLGVQWSTGPIVQDPATYQVLGVSSEQMTLIGLLYVGYPECIPNQRRQPLAQVVRYCP
jgi:nitroreductase